MLPYGKHGLMMDVPNNMSIDEMIELAQNKEEWNILVNSLKKVITYKN